MQLMTKELQVGLPKLYDTEKTEVGNKIAYIRYHEINSGWEWYLMEYNPDTKIAFGYVVGFDREFGYFSIEEMEQIDTIMLDEKFTPIKFSELNKSTEK